MDHQPNVTRRKPSRFRPLHSFSLRTMFVAVTIMAAVCACVAHEWRTVQARKLMLVEQDQLAKDIKVAPEMVKLIMAEVGSGS